MRPSCHPFHQRPLARGVTGGVGGKRGEKHFPPLPPTRGCGGKSINLASHNPPLPQPGTRRIVIAQQLAQHLIRVLAEQRRGPTPGRRRVRDVERRSHHLQRAPPRRRHPKNHPPPPHL